MDIKMILHSLRGQGKKVYLMLIQLAIAFLIINISLGMIMYLRQNEMNLKRIIPVNTTFKSTFEPTEKYKNTSNEEVKILSTAQDDLLSKIKSNPDIKCIGYYTSSYLYNNPDQNYVFIDNNIIKMVNFNILSGRMLNNKDFNLEESERIPVVVGSELAKKYPLGTVLKDTDVLNAPPARLNNGYIRKTYIVVGILKSDYRFWICDNNGTVSDFVKSTKDTVFIPFKKGDYFYNTVTSQINGADYIYQLNNENEIFNFNQYLNSLTKNNEYINNISSESYKNIINDYYEKNKVTLFYIIGYSIILTILAVFGTIGVILSSIEKRKREFGIRFAIGSDVFSLQELIIGELLVLFISACLIGEVIFIIASRFIPTDVGIIVNMTTFLYSSGICLMLIIFTSFLPLIRIGKLNPINLIRGEKNE